MMILRQFFVFASFVLLAGLGLASRMYAGSAQCGGLITFTWDDLKWSTIENCENPMGGSNRLTLRNPSDRGLTLMIWILPRPPEKGQKMQSKTASLQHMADMLGRKNKAPRISKTQTLGRFTWASVKNTNPSGKVSDVYMAVANARDGRLVYVVHTFEPHRSPDPAAVKPENLEKQFIEVLQNIQWQENK